jgi:predicted  nucleic acid-binding Zn-ribbon protein
MAGTQRNSPNSINIRLGELETQRRDLEERLIPLRLRITDLTEQLGLASNRVSEDRHRLRHARDAADD